MTIVYIISCAGWCDSTASYQTHPHLARHSAIQPSPSKLKKLWILRTPPHAPNLTHGSSAGHLRFAGRHRFASPIVGSAIPARRNLSQARQGTCRPRQQRHACALETTPRKKETGIDSRMQGSADYCARQRSPASPDQQGLLKASRKAFGAG